MKKSKVWYRKISEAISLLFKKRKGEKSSKRGLLMVLPFIVIAVVLVFIFFISNKNTDETSNSVTWPWLIGIIILAIIIADLRKPSSYARTLFTGDYSKYKKGALIALGSIIGIVLAAYFLLRWWDNRPTSPDAPIQYVSHSVTTGTLQTQHVSTASEVTTVPRENISTPVPLTLEHEYTLEPGTEYEWYNDSTKKYFLPVDCGTEMKLFVYTGDRSTHYIYEAERDTYGNVSEGKYDLVTPNRVPAGYFRIQLSTPDPIKVKYTAYLK